MYHDILCAVNAVSTLRARRHVSTPKRCKYLLSVRTTSAAHPLSFKLIKVKFALQQAMKTQRRTDLWLYSFFNLGARRVGWLTPRPGRFTPGKDTQYPLYRTLGGPQGRSRRLRTISPLSGFHPRTLEPVASCYTD